jgi:chromosome segregation ATPase
VAGIEAPEGSAAALAASSSMPCFFEAVRELRSDRETWEQQMQALEARHAQQIGNRFVLDDKLEALQKALKESEARAEKLKLREEERLRLGGVTAQNYQVLLEEKDLLEKKIHKLEDAVAFRAEKLNASDWQLKSAPNS